MRLKSYDELPALFRVGIPLCIGLSLFSLFIPTLFFFNLTDSAPLGWYLRSLDIPHPGQWAVVSTEDMDPDQVQHVHYLLKKIVAGPYDHIVCTQDGVAVNGVPIPDTAYQLPITYADVTLGPGEFFLVNTHPRSIDSRVLGPVQEEHLFPVVPIWSPKI